jgi:putative ABC transport system permease protein
VASVTFRDLVLDTFRTLWAHKVRTALTMFGIAWGIVSLTLMVGAGEGLRAGQQKQIDNLGKDLMVIFAGRTSMQAGGERAGRKLYWHKNDPQTIEAEATACRAVLPELGQGNTPVRSAFNSGTLTVTGSLPPFEEVRSIPMAEGRFYNWQDHHERRRIAVLGNEAKKQLFGSREALGETIHIRSYPYTVVGVTAFKEQDSSYDGRDVLKIFIPFGSMIRDFPNGPPKGPDSIDQMLAQPKSVAQHDECFFQIARTLGRIYNFDPTDKDAVPSWDTVESQQRFLAMINGMKLFLGAVGVVTLLLGGIGVMNVMLVAVRERTREIGLRKAVGATSRSILVQFFIETVLIVGFSGGVGVAIAYGICAAVNTLPMPAYFAGLLPTPLAAMLSLGMLGLIAVGAAMYPASRAASIDPIEALRFEAGG